MAGAIDLARPGRRTQRAPCCICLPVLAIFASSAAPSCTPPGDRSDPTSARASLLAHPGSPPTSLYVVPTDFGGVGTARNQELRLAHAALEGILARTEPRLWFAASEAYPGHLMRLVGARGLQTTAVTNPYALLTMFESDVAGVVLYDRDTPSVNVAFTRAGTLDAIPVTQDLYGALVQNGFTRPIVADARGQTSRDIFDAEGLGSASRSVVVQMNHTGTWVGARALGVRERAFQFFDDDPGAGAPRLQRRVFAALDDGAVMLGWQNAPPEGDGDCTLDASLEGTSVVPSDSTWNLTALSSVPPSTPLDQPAHPPAVPAFEENVHHVTFVWSDGDNLGWVVSGYDGWYEHPSRGTVPMGWPLPASLVDLAPTVLEDIYARATPNDEIVTTGGAGWMFPSDYAPGARAEFASALGDLMGRADIGTLLFIDRHRGENDWGNFFCEYLDRDCPHLDMASYEPFALLPEVEGLLVVDYRGNYAGLRGLVYEAGCKPVVTARYHYEPSWGVSEDMTSLVERLNSGSTDVRTPDAYSFVYVNNWNHSYEEVVTIAGALAPHVRVLLPGEFLRTVHHFLGTCEPTVLPDAGLPETDAGTREPGDAGRPVPPDSGADTGATSASADGTTDAGDAAPDLGDAGRAVVDGDEARGDAGFEAPPGDGPIPANDPVGGEPRRGEGCACSTACSNEAAGRGILTLIGFLALGLHARGIRPRIGATQSPRPSRAGSRSCAR